MEPVPTQRRAGVSVRRRLQSPAGATVLVPLVLLASCADKGLGGAQPGALTYARNPAVYTKGQSIANDVPTTSGGAPTSYSITPTPPQGLVLSPTTGILSGTPTALAVAAAHVVTARNAGGSTTATLTLSVVDAPPAALTYFTNPAVYMKGEAIQNNSPSSTGGAVSSYAIDPLLPAGLAFDTTTGVISGTPAALATQAPYTVTATNSGGSTTTTLTITVVDVPPSALRYSDNPAVYTLGQLIAPNAPSSSGGAVVSYAITPSPPAGLSFDPATGILSGTPTAIAPETSYTVTATNSGGSTSGTLQLTVNDRPPADLTYSTNPAVFTSGETITNDTPTYDGGAATLWAISPALPAGLRFDVTTGIVSGTPVTPTPETGYTVTATNSGGSAQANLIITVNDVAPSNLTYSANPAFFTRGHPIANDTPSSQGGVVVSYTISLETLPAGLSFNTTTGVLSGTPATLLPETSFLVTATNSGGSTQATLLLAVNDVPPSLLTYSTNPAVFTKGAVITNDTPSSSGGPVVSYAVAPPLPAGFSFSTATGVVSGTPAALSAETPYTVTATNSGGSTSVTLNVTVVDAAPVDLSYPVNPVFATKNTAIPSDVPTSLGGAVLSYAITPALPAGLSLDPGTGALSGTPTVVSTQTPYTVTATNSGGSAAVTLTITVNDVAPGTLTYATNPLLCTKGASITNDVPTLSGGAATSYTISGTLPLGLAFNTTTGALSGTPLALSAPTGYTVEAENISGTARTTLTIAVNDVAPSGLSYSANPAIFTKGITIPDDLPSSSGGQIESYAISGTLPAGLDFDATTGVLSGTPTELYGSTSYTVIATNTGGSAQVNLTLTVNDVPPSGLTYATNPAVFTKGVTIPNDAPSSAGGAVALYAISGTLPAGLSFNTTTGVLSGTPTALSPATGFIVTAINSGGSTQATLTITVNDVAPSGLSYATNPTVFTKGVAIVNDSPSNEGGPVVSYAISGTLPLGLSFDTTSGVLSGTPTVLSGSTGYLVTATNSGGSTQATLTITVNDVAPSNLAYATNPAVFTKGVMVTNDVPSSTGGPVTSYAISGTLPNGLDFNTTTGVLSGTPTALSTAVGYTVTATNSGGSTQATLTITVNDAAPSGLTYATSPAVFTKGVQIVNDAPSSAGGPVVSYAISGTLPLGLNFDPTTGVLSGTPTVLLSTTGYTVTATNSGGSTQATLTITVNDAAPTGLSYATNPLVLTKGVMITDDAPGSSGGAVVSYAISGTLPAGLSFNTTTGILSGDPTALLTTTGYTVTATSSGGSTQATLTITVNDVAPSGLSYATNPAIFTNGVTLTNDVPSSSGGPVVSYAISGTLPAGLSFNTMSGVLSGTPTALLTATGYTVTATNTGGSTQATLTITVNDVAPSNLSYSTNPAVFTQGTPVTADMPSASGGAITGYSISSALPSGLSFNTTTGVVSGTPTAVSAVTGYTVMATNTGGSAQVALILSVVPPLSTLGLNGNISVGVDFSCALVNDGVQCWGQNFNGNLGNNSTVNSSVPVQVSGLTSGAQTVAVGSGFGCALVNGGVWCWGQGDAGQLGNGSTLNVNVVPSQVTGLSTGVQAIAAGYGHACALVNGFVDCWGDNTNQGDLGNNTTVPSPVPVQVVGESGVGTLSGVEAISAGAYFNCAIVGGGVLCWGNNAQGQIGENNTASFLPAPVQVTGLTSGVQAISAGDYHACAVVNGGAWCWGSDTIASSVVPVQVKGLNGVGLLSGVTSLSAGNEQTCALTNGDAVCWGSNTGGQLGNNSTLVSTTVPVQVAGLTSGVQSLAAGWWNTCALVNGGVECWGNGSEGDLGNNLTSESDLAVQVVGLTSGVEGISGGGGHFCALVSGGVQCWGLNSEGQLGNDSTTSSAVPVQVSGLTSGVLAVTGGDLFTCALLNGRVQCWGYNGYGELGNNSTTNSAVPVQVSGLTSGVQAIAAGSSGDYACALVNGGVQCWGLNNQGELGNNSETTSLVPVQVSGLTSGVQAISVGDEYSCAVVGGGVQCWGYNPDGAINLVPAAVPGLASGVRAISASEMYNCAVVGGGVQCWGVNTYGQLGNNSTTQNSTPGPVHGLSVGVQAIAPGADQACALVNGGVQCWGYGVSGELGNNTTTNSLVPVPVSGLTSGVQAIAAANGATCALAGGQVLCWGDNTYGELGNNSTMNSPVPVVVSSWAQ